MPIRNTRTHTQRQAHAAAEDGDLIAALDGIMPRYAQVLRHVLAADQGAGRLTLPQLRLLQALAATETGIALTTQLARQMDVTVPTMTSRIDGLVERGFVERRPDPASRRQVHLLLTPSGRAHLDRCQTLIRARLRERLAPLTAAQKDRLLLALQDLALLLAPGEAGGGRRRSEESELPSSDFRLPPGSRRGPGQQEGDTW
jgi:DNA-binding MarR family transcriptional regulator